MESLPTEVFLERYPPAIRALADRLRAVVRDAVPDAIERVRLGWQLIGYDVPLGRRRAYFAYVAPEIERVHLGFEYGISLADPDRLLEGAHLGLRQVRFMTFRPVDPLPLEPLVSLTAEAARIATLPREVRQMLAEGVVTR